MTIMKIFKSEGISSSTSATMEKFKGTHKIDSGSKSGITTE